MNKSIQTMITASLLVAVVPILYLVFFIAQAKRDTLPSSVPGYLTKEACEEVSGEGCILVTTVQKDEYWISN